ncbi:MAG: Uma2 family endonuclease [Saprospiraceae bacterium]
MEVATKFPLTNEELAEVAGSQWFVRFPASLDEYWALLAEAEYRADYFDHEIIASMSYESDLHSIFANELATLLNLVFVRKKGFRVFNSNRPVHVPDCPATKTAVFNPDGMVVSLPSEKFEYAPGLTAETAPVLLFEVLSDSTRSYDFGTKLPCYKKIPGLRQIIFLEQHKPAALVFERDSPNRWTETELTGPDDFFMVDGQPISLRKIYRDVYL